MLAYRILALIVSASLGLAASCGPAAKSDSNAGERASGHQSSAAIRTPSDLSPSVRVFMNQLQNAGASVAEAECISNRFFSRSAMRDEYSDRTNTATALGRAKMLGAVLEETAEGCAPVHRLNQLAYGIMVRPLLDRLRRAGATKAEGRCILRLVEDVELIFSSQARHGDEAQRTAAHHLVRRGAKCGSKTRLREIVRQLHASFKSGR